MNPVCTKKFHRLQCLIDSCKSGDDRKLKYILETENCNGLLDSSDQNGRTLLHYCAEHENTECASLLLQKRPQLLTLQDDDGCTPLHLATISGNVPLLEFLVKEARKNLDEKQFNAFIDCYDNENHTAHHWATVCGEVECIKVLQVVGADPSLPDIHGAHPIHYASQLDTGNRMSNRRNEVIETILSYAPTERDARDKDGRTPLLWAASSGNVEVIEVLTRMKANVSLQDHDGLTALHCAASRGYIECLECLLELCGSSVDQTDSSGASALFYAVTLGHADCSQFLLHEGAAPNRQDRKGRTPAHCGAAKAQLETLKILFQNGGNLWLKNSRGDLPIHEAVKSGRKELVRWLLEQLPSSADFPNASGKTPLHVACFNGNIEMCQVLIDSGMDVNALMKSKNGWMTPLDVSLMKGHRSCAKFILLHGALPSSKLPDGTLFRGSSNQEALLDTESHSSSQSFIKEVRVPSKTHLKHLTKTVTSQRVQVFADGKSTPNSCVETMLSTDSRPETIITNVYVNTGSNSQKKSTLSKLIRRRSKKRSHSNNSGWRNSQFKDEYEDSRAMNNGHEYGKNFESYDDRDHADEETVNDELMTQKLESTKISTEWIARNGTLVKDIETRTGDMKQTHENLIKSNNRKSDLRLNGKVDGDEAEHDSELLPIEKSSGPIEAEVHDRNEDPYENEEDREERDISNIDSKNLRFKRGTEEEITRASNIDEERNVKVMESGVDGESKKLGPEEGELGENDNRGIEIVEYAQVLTDKIIGSGEVLDKLLAEVSGDNPSVKDIQVNESAETNFLNIEGKESPPSKKVELEAEQRNDETISEGELESEADIASGECSQKNSLEADPHKVVFQDTDSNSLHDSVSADETVVASKDDPASGKEHVHRSSTTFEIREHMEEELIDEERKRTSVRRKKSSTRGKRRNQSHCTHKYHFKQSFTTIQPLDLQHVRPKVDTGRSSSCTKSYSRASDRMAEFDTPHKSELMKKFKTSLRKYYTERKLFEELRELKKCQIASDRAHEKVLVKRLIDNFEGEIDYPGITKYTGSYDYKSYERFLYDQLRKLSQSNQGKLKKYSSEENIVPIPTRFQQKGKPRRTYSAEHLNMNQERHQAERFLGLEDFHLIERSPQTRTHWDKPTYHKVNSDIVRTAESLDYAIITRDGSSNIFRKETAIRFEPHTSLPPLPVTSTSRLRTIPSKTSSIETTKECSKYRKESKTSSNKVGNKTTSTSTNRNSVNEPTSSRNSRHKTYYSSGNFGSSNIHANKHIELKRKKTQIPPPQKVIISEDEIARRWQVIKEQEKQRKNSTDEANTTRSSPDLRDCTLIYEINGSDLEPVWNRGLLKRIHRTNSEPRATKRSGKPK